MVGVPSPGSSALCFPQPPQFFLGGFLPIQAQRGKHTSQKKEETQKLLSKLGSSLHPAHPTEVSLCLCIPHLLPAFYGHIPPVLLSRPFPSPPLSDLYNLKSCLGADIMTRPDFKINLPLDTGLFYWVHQG